MPVAMPQHTAWQALFKQYPALQNILSAVVGNNPADNMLDMVGPMAPAVGMAKRAGRNIGEELIEKAKKYFGTTNDIREAGYILPDGTMLDFSGKNTLGRKAAGKRGLEHQEISKISDDLGEDVRHGFIDNTDAVRVASLNDQLSVQATNQVSAQQRKRIADMMKDKNYIYIDRGGKPFLPGETYSQIHPQMSDVLKFLGEGN